MKVVHLCSYDRGGAANGALRLHHALLAAGVDSRLVVSRKTRNDPTILEVPGLWQRGLAWLSPKLENRIARLLCPTGPRPFGTTRVPGRVLPLLEKLAPDIVHLHWIVCGLISIEQVGRIERPIAWTFHDLWPLGPGYGTRVGLFDDVKPLQPLMPTGPLRRVAENVWRRKLRHWAGLDISAIAPSAWMAAEAKASALFQKREIDVIPYTVPLEVFRPPPDRAAVRRKLGLPQNAPLILFGADSGGDPRKGGDLLAEAMRCLAAKGVRAAVAIFGGFQAAWLHGLGFEVFSLGRMEDEPALAEVYGAADVFVCPSREDNLPFVVIESLACGTPVAGFRIGGMPDMVEDGVTGFLAPPFDTNALAEAILAVLEQPDDRLRRGARAFAERQFHPHGIVERHHAIYARLLARSQSAIQPPAGGKS